MSKYNIFTLLILLSRFFNHLLRGSIVHNLVCSSFDSMQVINHNVPNVSFDYALKYTIPIELHILENLEIFKHLVHWTFCVLLSCESFHTFAECWCFANCFSPPFHCIFSISVHSLFNVSVC